MSRELQNIQRQLQAMSKRIEALERANAKKDIIIRDLTSKVIRSIKMQRIMENERGNQRRG